MNRTSAASIIIDFVFRSEVFVLDFLILINYSKLLTIVEDMEIVRDRIILHL